MHLSGAIGFEHAENNAFQSGAIDLDFADDSAFAYASLGLGESLVLNGGVRHVTVDDDGADDSKTIFDVGAAYTFTGPGTTLRATYAQSYTRNHGFLFFINQFGQNKSGSLPIKDIETREVGLDQRFLGHRGVANITYFETFTEDMPTFDGAFTGDGFVATKDSRIKGLEFQVVFDPIDTLRLTGSFTWLDSVDTAFDGMSAIDAGQTNVPVSPLQAGLAADWRVTPRLRLHSMAVWEQGGEQVTFALVGPDLVRTETTEDSFVRWDAGVRYQLTRHARVIGKVSNLLDEEDFAYSTTTVDSLGNVTAAVSGSASTAVATSSRRRWTRPSTWMQSAGASSGAGGTGWTMRCARRWRSGCGATRSRYWPRASMRTTASASRPASCAR